MFTVSILWQYLGGSHLFAWYNAYSPRSTIKVSEDFTGTLAFNTQPNISFEQTFAEHIESAQKSLALVMYSLNSAELLTRIDEKHKQGVTAHIVTDQSKAKNIINNSQGSKDALTLISGKNNTIDDLMHSKFLITDQAKLLFTSSNLTYLQEHFDASFLLDTKDTTLITIFQKEFERLQKSTAQWKKLKDSEYAPFQAKIEYTNGWVEVWQSPGVKKNSLKTRILDLIKNAQHQIDIVMWQISDDDIVRTLIKASKRGVKIKLLLDDRFVAQSKLPDEILKNHLSNFVFFTDSKETEIVQKNFPEMKDFNPYIHEHTMIVDNEIALSGTANWTNNGFYKNDEITLISNVPFWVEGFQKSFRYYEERYKP